MDLLPAWCQACICGRTFSVPQAYTFHKRSCQKTKKWLSSALDKAKEVWQSMKCQKMEAMPSLSAESTLVQNVVTKNPSNGTALAMQHRVRLMVLVSLLLIESSPYLPEHLYEWQRLGSTAGRAQGSPGKPPTAQAVSGYAARTSSSPSPSTPTPPCQNLH